VNTITQGSASETAKLAMVDLMLHKETTGFPLQLIINVHDELVCTVPEKHADEGKEILERIMSGVRIPHSGERPLGDELPLAVKVGVSDRWEK
jgi:DNA polymerase I-like protein with 3'-5' exonuclease and polymerase domains